MSIEALKQELAALDLNQQRKLTAYLVSLQDERSDAYRAKLAKKIDQPASKFATLEELDQRLEKAGSRRKR